MTTNNAESTPEPDPTEITYRQDLESLQDLAAATTHLGERAGCTSFRMTWDCPHTPDEEDNHNCPDVRWHASINWRGTRLIRTAPDPGEALQAICVDLLTGSECRCGKPVHVEGGPPIKGGCTWSRDRDRWVPGCDADPIRVSGKRGDLSAMQRSAAMNRAARRAAAKKQTKRP